MLPFLSKLTLQEASLGNCNGNIFSSVDLFYLWGFWSLLSRGEPTRAYFKTCKRAMPHELVSVWRQESMGYKICTGISNRQYLWHLAGTSFQWGNLPIITLTSWILCFPSSLLQGLVPHCYSAGYKTNMENLRCISATKPSQVNSGSLVWQLLR